MSLIHGRYENICQQMRPGDVIAFGGNSKLSKFINVVTASSVSHVATIYQTSTYGDSDKLITHHIAESAKHGKFIGVTFNLLRMKIASYKGNVWWLPLSHESRTTLESNFQDFHDFIVDQHTKKYDVRQALRSALEPNSRFSVVNRLKTNSESHRKLFCSELVSASFKYAGILPHVNSSEITPADLCRFSIYAPTYVQLKGSQRTIDEFNSKSVPIVFD